MNSDLSVMISGGEMTPETFPGEWTGREVRVVWGRVAELCERGGRTRLGKGRSGSLTDANEELP